MSAPKEINDLVEHFYQHAAEFRSVSYNEATARTELINPLFEALGWDMTNRARRSGTAREVVHESALIIGSTTKAPDLLFRTEGRKRFYVEAKKPSVNVATDRKPAYQIRRYAWNAGLHFGIVTDFEEFSVYDCRDQPSPDDSAHVGRMKYLTYEQYGENWEWISERFSREAVLAGSLDRVASEELRPRRTRTVDAAFLDEISDWRLRIATDLARRNQQLSRSELNYTVQTTIDRIVFLRIAEARGLEAEGELESLARQPSIYPRLCEVFNRADERYNSGLFHFRRERGRITPPDDLTLGLTIGDDVLRHVLGRLYYPEPYEFSVISADILGQVYEQFLGQVITLDASHEAFVEPKPEVRKAGGVYYTPQFVVEYIVDRTLGPILRGKSVLEVEKLHVLDPACGSGSFLISAFQYLLDWHFEKYMAAPRRFSKLLERGPDGSLRLNTEERKRILLNNIFGVDLDPQAVEVTKLSLLLKVIEGEAQIAFLMGRLLPDLDNNVKCGNSIIAPDFDGPNGASDDEWASYRPFDWMSAFPEIMKSGGFDAVIGNPPYLNVDDVWGRRDPRLAYLKTAYGDIYTDKTDLLFYFLQKGVELSRDRVGMIVSRAFLEAYKARKLRSWLADHTLIREILDFRNALLFKNVGITTCVVLFQKTGRRSAVQVRRLNAEQLPGNVTARELADETVFDRLDVPQRLFGEDPWLFAEPDLQQLLDKMDAVGEPLGEILHIGQGMQTGDNKTFTAKSLEELADAQVPREYFYTRARNSDIHAYHIRNSGIAVIYPEDAVNFSDLPASLQEHLYRNQLSLEARAAYIRGNCEWWRFTWPLHKQYIHRRKILCPYLAQRNRFALDVSEEFLGLTDTTVLYDAGQPEDLRYILGLLNSRVLTVRVRYLGKLKAGGVIEYFDNTLARLPIPRRDPNDAQHREMIDLVDRAMALTSRMELERTPIGVAGIQNQLQAIQREIDHLACVLFGLTVEESRVIDGIIAADGIS